MYDKISNFDFTCHDAIPLTRGEVQSIIIYAFVIYMSGQSGLLMKCRHDTSIRNMSQPIGFAPDQNLFYMKYTGFTPTSQRIYIYGKFYRATVEAWTKFVYSNSVVTFHVTGSRTFSNGESVPFELDPFTVDLDQPGGTASENILLFKEFDSTFTGIDITLNVTGCLSAFDTFQISHFAQSVHYARCQMWFRTLFCIYAVVLFFWFSEDNPLRKLAALAILICYGPVSLFLWFKQAEFLFILDMLLQDLCSLFVLNLWFFSLGRLDSVRNFALMFADCAVVFFMVRDCAIRGSFEYRRMGQWAYEQASQLDYTMFGIAVGMIVVFYFTFLCKSHHPRDSAIDIATYSCFVALFCHVFDELLTRMKLLRVVVMGRPMRQFTELAAVWFITQLETGPFIKDSGSSDAEQLLADMRCDVVEADADGGEGTLQESWDEK
jgi:hypothetical protein